MAPSLASAQVVNLAVGYPILLGHLFRAAFGRRQYGQDMQGQDGDSDQDEPEPSVPGIGDQPTGHAETREARDIPIAAAAPES